MRAYSTSSLSNLIANLAEGIHKVKCKDCFLEYERVKDNLIKYKFLSCNKDYSSKFDGRLCFKKKNYLRTYLSFLIIISINLFSY